MKILNNIIQAFKVPVPLIDRILEVLALFMLIALLVLTAVLYQQAPEQIPTKFDWNNEPTNWTEKEMYWRMGVFFILMMLLSAASAYNLKMVRLPVRLKSPVLGLQKMLVSRMCRWTTLCMGILWMAYLLNTSAFFLDIPFIAMILEKVSLLALFAILIYYSVKIWWVGRRF